MPSRGDSLGEAGMLCDSAVFGSVRGSTWSLGTRGPGDSFSAGLADPGAIFLKQEIANLADHK